MYLILSTKITSVYFKYHLVLSKDDFKKIALVKLTIQSLYRVNRDMTKLALTLETIQFLKYITGKGEVYLHLFLLLIRLAKQLLAIPLNRNCKLGVPKNKNPGEKHGIVDMVLANSAKSASNEKYNTDVSLLSPHHEVTSQLEKLSYQSLYQTISFQ